MAKTDFSSGSVIPSAFMDKIFLIPHKHDDGTDDGHADKITLTDGEEVDGLLPHANMENIMYRNYLYMPQYFTQSKSVIEVTSLVVSMAKNDNSTGYQKNQTIIMDFHDYCGAFTIIDGSAFKHIADGGIVKNELAYSTQKQLQLYAIYDPTPSTGYKGLFVCESLLDAVAQAGGANVGYVRRIGFIPLYDDGGSPKIIEFRKLGNRIYTKPDADNHVILSINTYPTSTWPEIITLDTIRAPLVGFRLNAVIASGGSLEFEFPNYYFNEDSASGITEYFEVNMMDSTSITITGTTGKNVIMSMRLMYWEDDGDFYSWAE